MPDRAPEPSHSTCLLVVDHTEVLPTTALVRAVVLADSTATPRRRSRCSPARNAARTTPRR